MKQTLILIILTVLLSSCFEQGDCSDVSSNDVHLNFYNVSDRKARTITLDSIKIEGTDSVFYEGKSLNAVVLPLDPMQNVTIINFYYGNQVAQLDIQYNLKTFALAPDCPAIDLYSITEATGVLITEIFYTQRDISKNDSENLKLYF